jgi:hypothetical protein
MQEKNISVAKLVCLGILGNQIALGWICYGGRLFGFPNKICGLFNDWKNLEKLLSLKLDTLQKHVRCQKWKDLCWQVHWYDFKFDVV